MGDVAALSEAVETIPSCDFGVECLDLGTPFRLTLNPRLCLSLSRMIAGCKGHICDDLVGQGLFPIVNDPDLFPGGASSMEFESVIADVFTGFNPYVSDVLDLIPKIDPRRPWKPTAIQQLLALGHTGSTFLYQTRPLIALGSRIPASDSLSSGPFCYPVLTFCEGVPQVSSKFRYDNARVKPLGLLLCRPIPSLPVF